MKAPAAPRALAHAAPPWELLQAGMDLPAFGYELSVARLVAFVRATGLYDFVHFDREYAQAAGARDIFISAPHASGLCCRLLTDWAGPEVSIRSLTVAIQAQCCAGDLLTVSGRIARVYREGPRRVVDVDDILIGHALAPEAVRASATLLWPAGAADAGQPATSATLPARGVIDPLAPAAVRALTGQVREIKLGQGQPVTAGEVQLWCEALEDWNPLYWDADYATRSPHGHLLVPPAGRFLGIGGAAVMGIGCLKPGARLPEPVRAGRTGHALKQALREEMIASNTPFTLPGLPEVAVTRMRTDYLTPLPVDTATRTFAELTACSAPKSTRLGDGHFVSWTETTVGTGGVTYHVRSLTAFFYTARQ